MGGHVVRMVEGRGADRILVRKYEEWDHLEDLGLDVRIVLKWILKKWDGGIGLAQDRNRWRAFVNALMNFRVP